MILEFSITNFRSIKGRQTFSMLPSNRVKEREKPLQIVEKYPDLEVLPLALIYGSNNAGKSNLVRAFSALRWLVMHSHRFTVGIPLKPNESFLFDKKTQKAPTIFEIDFVATDKKRYLYTVEFSTSKILREELHYYRVSKTGRLTKRQLFVRNANIPIKYGDDFLGIKKPIEDRLIENVLYLSKSVQENNKNLRPILDFFQKGVTITSMSEGYIDFQLRYFGKVVSKIDKSNKLEAINNALRNIDSGILRIEIQKNTDIPSQYVLNEDDGEVDKIEKVKREEILDTLKHDIRAIHRFFDDEKEIGEQYIPLTEESEGTRKFIALFAKLMDMGTYGGVFIVDELERSLHPLLTKALLALLTNPKTNPKQAQLIFTSHDVTLFDVLDNDQINILEKDKYGATEIYTVSDIRGLRTGIPIGKWYLSGKLGGIPNINLDQITKNLDKLYEDIATR